ncbi:toxin VasX [Aquisalimonas asiatica]|uniref:Toxin VasX N-terminal region domain-containing protein n=1 Tax=Aquisalimonas asiatica TaxID=406100 RepID=A0A1H8R2R2_9GAMM|nr:toxin VasX [Aquisalimonas asiatica]SEO60616.1 hypothetical protein SAMN04488052_101947 [Aquisalimonas asiatica]
MSARECTRPMNAADVVDGDSGTPYSELRFGTDTPGSSRMELELRDSAGPYPSSLSDALEARGYGGSSGPAGDRYRIPLGDVNSDPADDTERQPDVGVMPVVPARFADPEGAHLAPVRDGWLYIFVNGHLWRELAVSNEGEVFRDVNLARHQGKDDRPATCESLMHHVTLPYRMNGEETVVEVAYAEIQWSWATIERTGGFADDDRRYCPDLAVYESYDITVDAALRDSRCQRLDLAAYDGDPDIGNLRSTFLVPTETAEDHCNQSDDPDEAPQLPGITEEDISAGFAIMALHDPMGIALEYVNTIQTDTRALKQCIEEISEHDHAASAVYANGLFYNEELHARHSRDGGRSRQHRARRYKDRSTEARELRDIARRMDRDRIEEILQTEKRRDIRKRIRAHRDALAHWLNGRCPNGEPVSDYVSQHLTIITALQDYAARPPIDYWQLWSVMNAVMAGAGPDPSAYDEAYDADSDAPETDPIDAWRATLLETDHPLFSMLFPDADQVDIDSEAAPSTDDLSFIDGTTKFRPGALAMSTNGFLGQGSWQVGKDIAKLAQRAVSDFILCFEREWMAALDQSQSVSLDIFMRLTKAGQTPEMTGMRVLRAGEAVPDGWVIADASVSVGPRPKRKASGGDQNRRPLIKAMVKNPPDEPIAVLDPDTLERVGTADVRRLGLAGVDPEPVNERNWTEVFRRVGKDGLHRVTGDVVIVPVTSDYARQWHEPDANVSDQVVRRNRVLRSANTGLPALVAIAEILSLVGAVNGSSSGDREQRGGRELAQYTLNVLGIIHALTEFSVNLSGREATANRMAMLTGRRIADRLVLGSINVPFLGPSTTLGVAGAALAGFSAALAVWDMEYRLRNGELGAGIAHGVEAAAMAGLTASLLGAAARRGAVGLLFGMGPWGWAFLAIGIVAGLVARQFSLSPLDRWASFGPFGADPDERLTEEYAQLDGEQIAAALLTILESPSIELREENVLGDEAVRVDVRWPAAFEEGRDLELQVTAEIGDEVNLYLLGTKAVPDAADATRSWWFRIPNRNEWLGSSWNDGRSCVVQARMRTTGSNTPPIPFWPSNTEESNESGTPEQHWFTADPMHLRYSPNSRRDPLH